MINKKKKSNKGFTLVELLVVIAIIGILAIVAVPALFSNINKAKATDVVADVRAIKTAVMAEYADNSENVTTLIGDGLTNDEIKSKLEVEDFSGEGEYTVTASKNPSKAYVEVVVDNKDIADKAEQQLKTSIEDENKVDQDTDTGKYVFKVTIYDGTAK